MHVNTTEPSTYKKVSKSWVLALANPGLPHGRHNSSILKLINRSWSGQAIKSPISVTWMERDIQLKHQIKMFRVLILVQNCLISDQTFAFLMTFTAMHYIRQYNLALLNLCKPKFVEKTRTFQIRKSIGLRAWFEPKLYTA